MEHDTLYHLRCESESPHLSDVRDDPNLGLAAEVLNWIDTTLADEEAMARLIEGDEDGDYWCGDTDGLVVSGPSVPVVRCAQCGRCEDSRRLLPHECPTVLLAHLRRQPFETPGRFRAAATEWETTLREHGIEVALCPGDVFQPSIWKDPLRVLQYEVFTPFALTGDLVLSNRLAGRFVDAGLNGVSIHALDIQNRFYPDRELPSFRLLSVHSTAREREELRRERGFVQRHCRHCDGTYYEKQEDLWISANKRASAYRRRGVLPRNQLVQADVFRSPIWGRGLVVTDRAFQLLSDADLSHISVRRILVVDEQ